MELQMFNDGGEQYDGNCNCSGDVMKENYYKKKCKPVSLSDIEKRLTKQSKNQMVNNTVLEVQNYHETLIEAMLRPDLGRAITFPLSMISGPSIPVHNRDTMFVNTNPNGCAWVEVNFGQYLDQGVIANGVNNGLANPPADYNTTTSLNVNVQVGNLPRGNIFYYYFPQNAMLTTSDLDGTTPLSPLLDNNGYISGVGLGTPGVAPSPLVEGIGIYTAIRCGPQTVTWDYTGRIDISQGIATMAINYTYVVDTGAGANQTFNPNNLNTAIPSTSSSNSIQLIDGNTGSSNPNLSLTNFNGFLPDYSFSTLKSVEDCPISVTVPSTENLTGKLFKFRCFYSA
jgi:hypothetical protein